MAFSDSLIPLSKRIPASAIAALVVVLLVSVLAMAFWARSGTSRASEQMTEDIAPPGLPYRDQTSEPPLRRRVLSGFIPAKTLRVIDGDTVEMRVSIWLGQDVVTHVRMRGIDAPELRARCEQELTKAMAAKQALTALLEQGDVFLTDVGYDKYGTRVVARIVSATHADLGKALLDQNLARSYTGGKRQSWCS